MTRPQIKFRTWIAFLVMMSLSAWAAAAAKQNNEKDEGPPPAHEAEITGKRVNIRTGPGKNFTRILKVSEGYRVVVTGRRDEWLRIRMPAECLLWIWKDYVKLDDEMNTGTVTADNVNVRIEPKLGADVVGQVDEDARVVVTCDDGDWYEIEPPATISAWVHSDYVKRIEPEK